MKAGPLLTFIPLLLTLPWAAPAGFASEGTFVAPATLTSSIAGEGQRPARMRFEVMDTNNDGVISREEWRGSARSFEVHDWNGDGRLSGNEVRIGAPQNTAMDEADHDPSRASASRHGPGGLRQPRPQPRSPDHPQ